MDNETRLPVSDAFIFFANSSAGTNSLPDGMFELPLIDSKERFLLISHLNYITRNIDLSISSELPDTIWLKPNSLQLEEVIVETRRTPQIRKKRLRDFMDAFIGDNKNQVDIKNPDALMLWMQGDTLICKAIQPLTISNEFLGYELVYILDSFLLYPNQDVKFEGQAYFQEMQNKGRTQARFRKNRWEVYQNSREYFFNQLIHDQLDTVRYKISLARTRPDRSFELFEDFKPNMVFHRVADSTYVISCNNFLAVVDRSQRMSGTTHPPNMPGTFSEIKPVAITYETSYLWSRTGEIILSSEGLILNQRDIEEFGYWSTIRTSSLLPRDYKPPVNGSSPDQR